MRGLRQSSPPLLASFEAAFTHAHHIPTPQNHRRVTMSSSMDTSGSSGSGSGSGKTGAEEKKDLGNKAYMAKKYEEAIARYSEAIELDPDSHIYYSNRSACHGAKGDWVSAAADAKICLDKDPDFLKGYYRLTMAQMEMKDFDAALETIKGGLKRQPDNAELQKQLRLVKAKKQAAEYVRHADSTGTAGRGMSGEELTEVQEQYIAANKELKEVRSKGVAATGEKRRNELCLSELSKVSEGTRLFNSVGKMFVLTPRAQVVSQLEGKVAEAEQRATDMEARHAYLEAKISSHEAILKEAARAGGASA